MDRYVIRDADSYEFLKTISNKGVETTKELSEAMILYNLKSAEKIFDFITFEINEDYIIEEIEFKTVKESVEEFED